MIGTISMQENQTAIDATTHNEIVIRLCDQLMANYIYPELAEKICIRLKEALQLGEYREYTDGKIYALALTLHMQEICQDEHLWVRWHANLLPDTSGPLYQNTDWLDNQRKLAELENYGLHKVERLPGNVGYLDIRQFHRAAWGAETAAAAMSFIANCHALIIDLRNCLGGHADMVVLISSYLFGAKPVYLGSIYWRDEDLLEEYWTNPVDFTERFTDKPVYLLTSKATFSAAEAFALALQSHQRAVLIGEKTDGGAHPGALYRLHPHFEVFIPVGRAFHPVTNEDWEGKGITPDIQVSAAQALKTGYQMALEFMLENNEQLTSETYLSIKEEAEAALKEIEALELIHAE